MSQPERYEILILGSGAGGKLLSWHMAKSGKRTAVIERKLIGGSCPNIACLPSKNEIWSAHVAHLVRNAAQFGTKTASVSVDMAIVRKRKRQMVEDLVAIHVDLYKESGAELIMGSGHFVAPKTIEVKLNDGSTRVLTGDKVFINVGTRAAIPDVSGLAAAKPLTHVEALDIDYLPSHLIVIGGGYVGLELAQAYRRFGSRVTIIQHGRQIMTREDRDVAEELQKILAAEGIEILLESNIVRVEGQSGKQVKLVVRSKSGEQTIEGSDILVAAGRVPNTAEIGLKEAGVEIDARGYVKVNERLESTAPEVWGIGDCAGSPFFTHASEDDFRVIRDNLAGGSRNTHDRMMPYCMFTDPPLAHIGLSETEAQQQGIAVRVSRLSMSHVLRTHTTGEKQGFMKALVSANDDRILGFTMIGQDAGEVMAIVETAMMGDLPYTRLRDAVIAHPTMAEGLNSLFSNVPERSAEQNKVHASVQSRR